MENKYPFRLAPNKAISNDIAWQCKHYTGRGVMKLHESGAALAGDMGVLVSKMQDSIEARIQASLKAAQDPDGAVPSVSKRQVSGRSFWQDGFRNEVLPQRHFGSRFRNSPTVSIAWFSAAWQEELAPGTWCVVDLILRLAR